MPSSNPLKAFIDESSAPRGDNKQEYLIGALIISSNDCESVREALLPLLLPGQIKLHWTDESELRRRTIVKHLCALDPMNVVITHLSERRKKNERFRRKCLEDLYYEMVAMGVYDLALESRSRSQDSYDRAHIVALQTQGLDRRIRIGHLRGGDEPLLWIADVVLGAINSDYLGEKAHLAALSSTFLVHRSTRDSIPSCEDERP